MYILQLLWIFFKYYVEILLMLCQLFIIYLDKEH